MSKHIRVTVFEEDGSSYDLVDTRGGRGVEHLEVVKKFDVELSVGANEKPTPHARWLHTLTAEWLTTPTTAGGPGPRPMPVVKKGKR